MELETLNMNQICRTCKCVAPQMRSLFEAYENAHQSPRIDEMLMACASIQVNITTQGKTLTKQILIFYLYTGVMWRRITSSYLSDMCRAIEKCFPFQTPMRENRFESTRIRKKCKGKRNKARTTKFGFYG